MQTLQTLIRNLAIILLLATFMEMLLPTKNMRGYVQLVMGLFVVSAILNPLVTFIHHPLELEIPAWTSIGARDLPVLATDGSRVGRDAVEEQYRRVLINQIKAVALGVEGVGDVAVEIGFGDGGQGPLDQPKITEVEITLKPTQGGVQPVRPVVIGREAEKVSSDNLLAREVREKVAKLMEIPEEKIDVNIEGGLTNG